MKERGARFNASTWFDRTNYHETLASTDANLEFAIRLEADRLMNSFIRGADLKSEMTVVRNEFEMGENSPEAILMQRMVATAYEWHNYGKSTIGNRADIERVPIENLHEFYTRYYQPDNAFLVVAGKFQPKKVLELVAKYFGPIPRPERRAQRDLHRRAAAGRRAGRAAPPRGEHGRRRSDVSHPGRRRTRVPGRRGPGQHPFRRTVGPLVQVAGRDEEGGERLWRGVVAARSGGDDPHGPRRAGTESRGSPRRA